MIIDTDKLREEYPELKKLIDTIEYWYKKISKKSSEKSGLTITVIEE